MKKLSLLLASFVGMATLVFNTSCTTTTDSSAPSPTVEIISVPGSLTGSSVTINNSQRAKFKLAFRATKTGNSAIRTVAVTVNGNGSQDFSTNPSAGTKTITSDPSTLTDSLVIQSVSGTWPFDNAGTYTVRVNVTNAAGTTGQATFTVNVVAPTVREIQSTLQMGGQDVQTLGSFFSLATVSLQGSPVNVLGIANAKANASSVDMAYYFGATNSATFSAPASNNAGTIYNAANNGLQTWTTRNATKFTGKLSSFNFDGATVNDINTVVSTPQAEEVVQLAQNDMFGFQTVGNRKAVARVTALTTGATGNITIRVKYID